MIDKDDLKQLVNSNEYIHLASNQKVAAIRMFLDITQGELGEEIGCTGGLISRVERGEKRITPEFQGVLAKATGLPIRQLFREDQVARYLVSPLRGRSTKINPTKLPDVDQPTDIFLAMSAAKEVGPARYRNITVREFNALKRRVAVLETRSRESLDSQTQSIVQSAMQEV